MKEIRTVIIGFGGMGKKYAKIIAEGQAPGLTIQGICCRNQPGQQEIPHPLSSNGSVSGCGRYIFSSGGF